MHGHGTFTQGNAVYEGIYNFGNFVGPSPGTTVSPGTSMHKTVHAMANSGVVRDVTGIVPQIAATSAAAMLPPSAIAASKTAPTTPDPVERTSAVSSYAMQPRSKIDAPISTSDPCGPAVNSNLSIESTERHLPVSTGLTSAAAVMIESASPQQIPSESKAQVAAKSVTETESPGSGGGTPPYTVNSSIPMKILSSPTKPELNILKTIEQCGLKVPEKLPDRQTSPSNPSRDKSPPPSNTKDMSREELELEVASLRLTVSAPLPTRNRRSPCPKRFRVTLSIDSDLLTMLLKCTLMPSRPID